MNDVAELVRIRHDLHRHPELGFEEIRTQKIVRDYLTALGYRPVDSAKTGLYADLHPDLHREGSRTIALRADLDCLPIDEKTDLPHRSIHPGRAHKCGHDGHTAILLGTARALAKMRDRIPGNVRLIFQPAEEGVNGGGAKVMVEEGVLDGVREVYGLHNWPGFAKGVVHVKAGPMLAQVHEFYLDIEGVGGHGSQPQLCRDPIVSAAHLVTALQTLVSRELGYEGGAVVSVTAFNAGNTHNVIPRLAQLKGTIRTFEPAIGERILRRFREIIDGAMSAFATRAKLELIEGYPVVHNDATCAEAVARVAAKVANSVSSEGLPIAGGEDFAYFTRTIPGAYFFLGAKRPGEDTPSCHHPDFDFDDDLIPIGIRMFLGLVEDRLRAVTS